MRGWLLLEAKAGRYETALGEPTLATPRQLEYAFPLRGRKELYMARVE
jgi:hypothetical protein